MQMTFKGCLFERIQGFFLVDGLAVRELPNGPIYRAIPEPGVFCVENPKWGKFQFQSVELKLKRIEEECKHFTVMLTGWMTRTNREEYMT
jgi:hypothetical protein